MKFNIKFVYYYIIIVAGLISVLVTLIQLKSRNKSPSISSIKNTLDLYIEHYYNKKIDQFNKLNRIKYIQHLEKIKNKNNEPETFNITKNISMYIYPFDIEYKSSESNKFDFYFDSAKNVLYLNNINSLTEENYSDFLYKNILSKFGLNINASLNINETLNEIKNNLPIYSSVNIYIWISNNEKTKSYINHIEKLVKEAYFLNEIGPIVVKFIVYDSENGVINNEDLYSDIKKYNSKRLFNEINEENILNIHLLNNNINTTLISTYFNNDLNSLIFYFNFKTHIKQRTFILITKYLSVLNLYTDKEKLFNSPFINNNTLNELAKIFNSKNNLRHLKFMAMLNNLEKISRIFPLYETILTVNKVKIKIDKIMLFLRNVVKNDFSEESMADIDEIYVDTIYLMNSNELVIFEHFFSFEFKIGQFLPITSPILYGLFKSFKSLTL